MSSEHPIVTSQPPPPPPLNFVSILREMLRASDKVSDLIFSPGRPPQIELAGKLVPVRIAGLEKLTPAHTAGIAKLIIANQQAALDSLEKTGSADLSFSVPGDARFRVNIFRHRGSKKRDRACHRTNRQRQEFDPRSSDRFNQRELLLPHRHHRRSD